jgi:hypothetical protein
VLGAQTEESASVLGWRMARFSRAMQVCHTALHGPSTRVISILSDEHGLMESIWQACMNPMEFKCMRADRACMNQ